jgi:hypothetical protein
MKEVRCTDEQSLDPEGVKTKTLAECTETERLESAVESIGKIEKLQPAVWTGLTELEREWALRQVGEKLSTIYEVPSPPFFGREFAEVKGGIIMGEHSDSEYIIHLNRELLKADNSGEALSTYCHEFRHAYQNEMANRYDSSFRHLCHDETQAAKWAENLGGHYRSFEESPDGYEAQPVERDARDFAQRIMTELHRS